MRPLMMRPRSRRRMPQIAIQSAGGCFQVLIDGCPVRDCRDEIDAHHWAKHAFEAVSSGARTVSGIRAAMERICNRATIFNLHTHHFPPGYSRRMA